jgi:hypothetical protein
MNVTWHIFSLNLMLFFCSHMCDTWFKWKCLCFLYTLSYFDPQEPTFLTKESTKRWQGHLIATQHLKVMGKDSHKYIHYYNVVYKNLLS